MYTSRDYDKWMPKYVPILKYLFSLKKKQTSKFLIPTFHFLLPTISYYPVPPYVVTAQLLFSLIIRNFFELLIIQNCFNTIMEPRSASIKGRRSI